MAPTLRRRVDTAVRAAHLLGHMTAIVTVPPVGAGGDVTGRAAVTYTAPHGAESCVLSDGDVTAFGRGADCLVRFGYAPQADIGVPRVAGRFIVAGRRVFVESTDGVGRRSLEISIPGRPPVLVAVGDGFAPSEPEFRVTVHGERQAWTMSVVVRRDVDVQGGSGEPPTRHFQLQLTDMQRRVVAAYMEPLRNGRLEPATHREAAAALSYHPNSAREALYEVWSRIFAAGIPMPDVSEKRVAVVEAVRLHRLLAVSGDDE
jgi:hypothetical protein